MIREVKVSRWAKRRKEEGRRWSEGDERKEEDCAREDREEESEKMVEVERAGVNMGREDGRRRRKSFDSRRGGLMVEVKASTGSMPERAFVVDEDGITSLRMDGWMDGVFWWLLCQQKACAHVLNYGDASIIFLF